MLCVKPLALFDTSFDSSSFIQHSLTTLLFFCVLLHENSKLYYFKNYYRNDFKRKYNYVEFLDC